MKKNIFIWTIAMLFVSCGPDTRLDMVGMFAGSSPTIDERFEQSQQYNQQAGFATIQALTEEYHVYEIGRAHV